MERLISDVLAVVLSFLPASSIVNVSSTCKRLHVIVEQNHVWHELLRQVLWNYSPVYGKIFNNCKDVLKRTHSNSFVLEQVSVTNTVDNGPPYGQYLHRSVRTKSGCFFMIGGRKENLEYGSIISNPVNPSQSLLSDMFVWEVQFVEEEHGGPLDLGTVLLIKPKMIYHPPSQLPNSLPVHRYAQAMCAVGDLIFMFSGVTGTFEFLNDLWMFNTITLKWTKLMPGSCPKHGAPAGCLGHNLLAYEHLTKTGSRTFLLLFGGSAPGVCFNDIWLLDVSDYLLSSGSVEAGPVCIDSSTAPTRSCVWKCAKWLSEGGTSVICGRSGQSASLIGDILYIIGGNSGEGTFDDIWSLNVREVISFSCRTVQIPPTSSSNTHGVDVPEDVLSSKASRDIRRGLLPEWTQERPRVLAHNMPYSYRHDPLRRIGHHATVIGNQIIIYGGRHRQNYRKTVCVYKPLNNTVTVVIPSASVNAESTGMCAFALPSGIMYYGGLLPNGTCSKDFVYLCFSEQLVSSSSSSSGYSFFSGMIDLLGV